MSNMIGMQKRRFSNNIMMYNIVNNLVHRPPPNSIQQVSCMPNLAAQILEKIL